MSELRFSAIIKIIGVNPYVLVSAARAKKLKAGWRRPMPVLVQVNGKPEEPWKINMMPRGDGSFFLYLQGEVRKASGTGVGDKVDVVVRFDESYKGGPQNEMPASLKKEIAKNAGLKKAWDALTPSRQKEILRYLAFLKSDEARERNVRKVIVALSGKKTHYMGRDWDKGK